jgi:hypothetical protein
MTVKLALISNRNDPQPIFSDEARETLGRLFSARADCFAAIDKLEELGVIRVDHGTFPLNEFLGSVDWCQPGWEADHVPSNQQAAEFLADAVENGCGTIRKIAGRHLHSV